MQENKNTEDNKKCIKNEQNIPINNLKSYNLIFNKGCVNVEGFKKYNNEYDNFEIIDNAVKYIKQSDNLDKEKHLNRVKATKTEYEKSIKILIESSSFFTYVVSIITAASFINDMVNFISKSGFGFPFLSLLILFIIGYLFYQVRCDFKKENKILKYLTYLEKQLESDE